jgi:uncharacterized membrane protein YeaQ/YmgE (transglycosylase-associated protein family)
MRADIRRASNLNLMEPLRTRLSDLAPLRRDFWAKPRLPICLDNQSVAPAFSSLFSSEFFCDVHRLRRESERKTKNMHLSDQGLFVILVVGLIAGWLAGKVVRGNGFGLVGDAAIGIVGALIGDWLLHRLGIHFGSGIIGLIVNATIGAIVLLLALRLTGASGWGGR